MLPFFMWDLNRSSRPLLILNHQALFLRIAYGGAKRVEMTQNHQVTRFWSRRTPDSYLHQFSSPCFPFMQDLKRSSRPLFIPNHQALFLRISHGGAKGVEMTQNNQVTCFWSRIPPDSYPHQFSSPCSPLLWHLKRSSRSLFIRNHQALFLIIAHGGAKRVEMTQISSSYTLLEQ